jgi:hypothetical protein
MLLFLLYVQVNWRYAGRIPTEVEYPLLPDPALVFGFASIARPRRPGPITGTHAAGTGCCKCPHHCDNGTVVIPMARFVWFLLLPLAWCPRRAPMRESVVYWYSIQ